MNASQTAWWGALAVWFGLSPFVNGKPWRFIPIGLACFCVAAAIMSASGEWTQ